MDRSLGVLLAAWRRRVRSTGARVFVGVLAAALALAIWLPSQGAAGGAVVLESVLVVIGVCAGLVASSSAGALPEDRGSGVHAWLAATACPRPVLRAAPAVAGAVLTVAVTLGATLLAAITMGASGLDVPTRRTTALATFERAEEELHSYAGDHGLTFQAEETYRSTVVDGLAGSPGTNVPVEIEVRPHYADPGATDLGSVRISFHAGGASIGEGGKIPVRGRSDLLVPAVPGLSFHSEDSSVQLTTVSARRIDGPASFLANVLRAGLLLGLALASIAPTAGLLSRFLSASSAVSASLLLAGVGVLHGPLLVLAGDARDVEGASIASAILRGATWLAPDLSVVSGASEALVGHVLSSDAFAGLVSPTLHAAVALLLLAFLPARREDA